MRSLLMCFIISFVYYSAWAQSGNDQNYSFDEWQKESYENIRLLPRYGYAYKSAGQLAADKEFIANIKTDTLFTTMRNASDRHVALGFEYLYRGNLRVAMYRFNQAYLLDSTNTDDYWGYGSVYMQMGRLDLAEHQYLTGLSKDSLNHHLWTDLATVYSARAQNNNDTVALNKSIGYLQKSYAIQPKDVNTVYKLSVSHYLKGNCKEAQLYLGECEALGGQPITPEFRAALKNDCK